MEYPADKLYEDIESWLDGKMTSDEANEFNEKLTQDKALQELVAHHRLAREVIDEWIAEDYQSQVDMWKQELPDQVSEQSFWKKKLWWLIPAGALLLVTMYWIINKAPSKNGTIDTIRQTPVDTTSSDQNLNPNSIDTIKPIIEYSKDQKENQSAPPVYAEKPKQDLPIKKNNQSTSADKNQTDLIAMADASIDSYNNNFEKRYDVTRGDESNTLIPFEEGRKAFIQKATDKAIKKLLEAVQLKDKYTTDAMEILAIIYYRNKDYHNAAEMYEQFATRKRGQDSDWRLAMFYLADYTFQKEKFKIQLDKMISTEGHKYQSEAQRLKNELIKTGVLKIGD